MDRKIFRLLQEADWGEIGKELTAFAVWRAQNYQWRYGRGQDLALGKSVEDIVHDVILKTISGERKWDPEKGDLVPWLKDQVKSIMDALVKSAAHRYETGSLETMDEEGIADTAEYHAFRAGSVTMTQSPGPQETVLQNEHFEEQASTLFQAMDGHHDLEQILAAVWDGCELKPRILAAELGVPVRDINNRLKRIRRRISKLKGGAL